MLCHCVENLHFVHCLLEVCNDVLDILQSDTEADEVRCYAGFAKLFVRELAMGVAGRMEYTGTCIGHMSDDADEVEVIHEADGILPRTFQTEGYDTA